MFGFFTKRDIEWDGPETVDEAIEQYGSALNFIRAVKNDTAGHWSISEFARLQMQAIRELAGNT